MEKARQIKLFADMEMPQSSAASGSMSVHFLGFKTDWQTPQAIYAALDDEFSFTLDPCAVRETAKCQKYYTKEDNGLARCWSGEIVFMNPPYGKEIVAWMAKAYREAQRGATVVCLVPSRTDTRWWHDYAMQADEIRFIKGRLTFGDAINPAPFPSCVIVFRGAA